ncbi:MAG: hypothetical protein AMXMBFR44_4260 [Candidatus Campbellbacteria bacterium]
MKLKDLLNHTFFKFVLGFLGVLLVSFLVLFVVNMLMFSTGLQADADIPFSNCITNAGEPC